MWSAHDVVAYAEVDIARHQAALRLRETPGSHRFAEGLLNEG